MDIKWIIIIQFSSVQFNHLFSLELFDTQGITLKQENTQRIGGEQLNFDKRNIRLANRTSPCHD